MTNPDTFFPITFQCGDSTIVKRDCFHVPAVGTRVLVEKTVSNAGWGLPTLRGVVKDVLQVYSPDSVTGLAVCVTLEPEA